MIDAIRKALTGMRPTGRTENSLQRAVAARLSSAKIEASRETPLRGVRCRPDFMVGGIVVELKVKGGLGAVTSQLHRYAEHEDVEAVILVTTLLRHTDQPDEMCGKPVRCIYIGNL